jgi:TonB family protein
VPTVDPADVYHLSTNSTGSEGARNIEVWTGKNGKLNVRELQDANIPAFPLSMSAALSGGPIVPNLAALDSHNIHVVTIKDVGYTKYAGLKWKQATTVNIWKDGTIEASGEGITASDVKGMAWTSRKVHVATRTAIVMVRPKGSQVALVEEDYVQVDPAAMGIELTIDGRSVISAEGNLIAFEGTVKTLNLRGRPLDLVSPKLATEGNYALILTRQFGKFKVTENELWLTDSQQTRIRAAETRMIQGQPVVSHGTISSDVIPGQANVRGSLDREIVRGIIRRHVNEVKYCYESELAKNAELSGRVSVQFTIDGSGQVIASALESSTIGNPSVETCVIQAVRRWEFPAPPGGGIVIVSYPFNFTTGV